MATVTVYCPVMSGRSIVRPATLNTGAPAWLMRSAILKVGMLDPNGLAVRAAADPLGRLLNVQTTLVMSELVTALFTKTSRYAGWPTPTADKPLVPWAFVSA